MSAYILVDMQTVDDPGAFETYRQEAPATVAAFGGEYVLVGGEAAVLEGSWLPGTLVLLRFADREKAEAWWNSAEYAPLKALRQGCSASTFVVASGLA